MRSLVVYCAHVNKPEHESEMNGVRFRLTSSLLPFCTFERISLITKFLEFTDIQYLQNTTPMLEGDHIQITNILVLVYHPLFTVLPHS